MQAVEAGRLDEAEILEKSLAELRVEITKEGLTTPKD